MKLIHEQRAVLSKELGERGVALVVTLLVISLLSVVGFAFLTLSVTENTIAYNEVHATRAFGIAEAGIEHARRELITSDVNTILASNPPLITFTVGGQIVGFGGGTYSVTVANNTTAIGGVPADPGGANTDTDNILILTSTGTFQNATSSIEATVQNLVVLPPGARAAVTTNGPAKTNGNITIDGRNHDMDGNLIPDSGTYSIFTADTYTQSGNSHVGGTDTGGNDHAPDRPGDPSVIVENYSGSMPTTPDEVMGGAAAGYPEGTLKSMAQSGANGSQYVSDPANLSSPLSGVTYVELPCGDTWQPTDVDGSGILVVHNACTDAVIKNLNFGTLKGLLIADDIVHIHTTIIGAVVSLTTGPSSGNVLGNGSGEVLFSGQAIANAIGGGGSQSYSILAWHQR
ncbi:MAG: PilX N-terminal domain-containing pilus assembly protein [Candidatus Methylomirabilales bacterium]